MFAPKTVRCAKCGRTIKDTEAFAVVVKAYDEAKEKTELLLYRFHTTMPASGVMQNVEELVRDFHKQAEAEYGVAMGSIEADNIKMTVFVVLPVTEAQGSRDLVANHFRHYQKLLLDQVVEVMDDASRFRDYFFAFPQLKRA